MNAPATHRTLAAPALHEHLLGLLAPAEGTAGPEADWLRQRASNSGGDPLDQLTTWLREPPDSAVPLLALVAHLRLGLAELVALALASAVETDAMAARVVAWLQAPLPGSRPVVGLVARIAQRLRLPDACAELAEGEARRCQVLQLGSPSGQQPGDDGRPLVETSLRVPLPLVLALQGRGQRWPGVPHEAPALDSLAPGAVAEAARQAAALGPGSVLVVRSGDPREAQAACAAVARALGRPPAFLAHGVPDGFGAWAWLSHALPVVCADIAPGEQLALPAMPGHDGPVLVACGLDGSVVATGERCGHWTLPLPGADERRQLWQRHVDDPALALALGHRHRCGGLNIHLLARAARHGARLDGLDRIGPAHIEQATRAGVPDALGPLAERLAEDVADDALVLPPGLRAELDALRQRCQLREGLADALGAAARTRYRPGVRALFVGASGTGKTLAAAWLAARLGLPLYRIDVAAVTSKYIGETEKNLAQLFARAEQSEGVLLFDEADALFGKRTEVKEANDRFANTQTNYLLQRIESFDGIALLTSNSRARFDPAFTRRLDAILDFALPGPEERRRLWLAHLGDGHALDTAALNRLAAGCDLAGGHVRNASLMAAVAARHAGRPIGYGDVLQGVAAEYRKLGRQLPAGLHMGGAVPCP